MFDTIIIIALLVSAPALIIAGVIALLTGSLNVNVSTGDINIGSRNGRDNDNKSRRKKG